MTMPMHDDDSLFADESGNAVLRESLILYLDELGTADSASAEYSDANLRADLHSYQEVAGVNKLLGEGIGFRQITKTFSDNVIYVVPRGPVRPGSQLEVEPVQSILLAAAVQTSGISAHRVFRGGLAIGKVYADADHILGPGLVEAVRAEERIAIYPRVVVNTSVLDSIDWSTRGGQAAWDSLLVDNSDDVVFVHYLHLHPSPTVQLERLVAHKSLIANKLSAFSGNERVSRKYRWLGRYHNWYVQDALKNRRIDVDPHSVGLLLSESDGLAWSDAHLEPWFSTVDRIGHERVDIESRMKI